MSFSRRKFLSAVGLTTVAGVVAANTSMASPSLWSVSTKTLKVGLIGCGGRGTAAAMEALNADPNVVLHAMADAFGDHLDESYKTLKEKMGEKIQVKKEQQFVGLDAYKKLLSSGIDVVILASPPAFRPAHLEASVEAGKHIFCEKLIIVI